MLHKISTPILLAILCYHGYHYFLRYQLSQKMQAYHQQNIAKVETVPHVSPQPRIIKVSDKIYVAIEYAIANSIMLIGNTGVVIIDTTESEEATKEIYSEFRKITNKPVKGIIYTHNHADHVLGTRSFLPPNQTVEIWGHHTITEIYSHSTGTVGQAHFLRAMRQFGGLIQDKVASAGIGRYLRIGGAAWDFIPPNRFLYDKQKDIHIAGIDLRLIHIPGETDDQIGVYWPVEDALFCADNFYKAFPNLYAIRGTPFRSLQKWKESLDIMRNLKPKLLIPSHTEPTVGREEIYKKFTNYRDAIQLVHDQTVRFMNKGLHPDDIALRIHLPDELKKQSYLKEFYGTLRWSSKSLFSGYMGWFSGDINELNPHTPKEKAFRMVKLAGGVEKIIAVAKTSLDENDPQWALTLTSAVLLLDENNEKAKEIKAKSLFDMAAMQTSMNGRNYYLTCAYELLGDIINHVPDSVKKGQIQASRLSSIFHLLSLRIKAEDCSTVDKVVEFNFTDTNEHLVFHLRNGIMDLSGSYIRKPDIDVTVNSKIWKDILIGYKSGLMATLTSELNVNPSASALNEVMACMDSD